MQRRDLGRLLLAATAPLAWPALADGFPQRPVKIVVPYTPGGTNDILARMIATQLQAAWGQPVIVENRPGASGTIGADFVAKSPGDGHTLMLTITALLQNASLMPNLPYDPLKDFVPVTQLSTSANLLVVSRKLQVNSVAEFAALVRSQPGRHSYGSYGVGTSAHLLAASLAQQAKLDMVHAPYKGAMPMLNDLLGGHLSAAFLDLGTAREHLQAGGFKVLAATGPQRAALVPDAPTFAELGYKNFEWLGWFGVFAPRGTPMPLVEKISADIRTAVNAPEIATRIAQIGQQRVAGTPQAFAEVVRRDGPLYARMAAELGIKLE